MHGKTLGGTLDTKIFKAYAACWQRSNLLIEVKYAVTGEM